MNSNINFQKFKTVKSFKVRTLSNDIVFTNADKGNLVMAIKNNDYVELL